MTQGNYANVNGLNLYYETYGDTADTPLILLHGGFGVIGMFAQVLPALAETHQVIGVELEGHGHTALLDRPLTWEQMADDLATFVRQLGVERADLVGYSLGGGVALQTAIRHTEVVHKLVVISAPCKSDGWYPGARAGMRAVNGEAARTWVESPMYQAYASVAPRPEDWPLLADKVGPLVSRDYDWTDSVAALKTPTMIVIGDADAVRPAHALQFFELLGGGEREADWDGSGRPDSRLAILPGTTHYDSFSSPLLVPIITSFLDAPMRDSDES